MATGIRVLIAACLCLLCAQLQAAEPAATDRQAGRPAQVLLLLSYEPTYPAAQIVVHTIRDNFAQKAPDGVRLHVEFMDADFSSTPEYLAAFRDLMAKKHAADGLTYDVVIAAGQQALSLVADNYRLFHQPQVVFLGVSDADLIRRVRMQGNFTGLPEALPVYEYISFMRYLFPGFKSIHAITDGLPGREERLKKLRLATDSLNENLVVHSLDELSWQALQQKMTKSSQASCCRGRQGTDDRGTSWFPVALLRLLFIAGQPVCFVLRHRAARFTHYFFVETNDDDLIRCHRRCCQSLFENRENLRTTLYFDEDSFAAGDGVEDFLERWDPFIREA